jgi:hypothetical protein
MISLVGAAGVVIGVAFFIRALSARTLSQERVPHHSKRVCSNPLLQTMSR